MSKKSQVQAQAVEVVSESGIFPVMKLDDADSILAAADAAAQAQAQVVAPPPPPAHAPLHAGVDEQVGVLPLEERVEALVGPRTFDYGRHVALPPARRPAAP